MSLFRSIVRRIINEKFVVRDGYSGPPPKNPLEDFHDEFTNYLRYDVLPKAERARTDQELKNMYFDLLGEYSSALRKLVDTGVLSSRYNVSNVEGSFKQLLRTRNYALYRMVTDF